MTNDDYLNRLKDYSEELQKDPVRLKTFLRSVMGPPSRTLEGKERDDILLLLTMIEPYSASNNQHSWTECYMIGDKDYHVTVFPGEAEIVDLMLPEDEDDINM